jgi:dTDP-4-amino-4,6-dideoxygalactose transaminase
MNPMPWRELPPTGGLPMHWSDFAPSSAPELAAVLAEQIGATHAQLTCSGTAALVVALTTLAGMSERREVVVPAFTCPLVALAVAHCGLRLRICDLLPNHFDMDPDKLATLCGPQTLAIVPTHLGGRVADVGRSSAIARRVGAWVIEDAAQAFGARHADGTAVGLAGDIGFFSLAAGKGLTIYEGGLLVSRDAPLHAAMERVASAMQPQNRWLEWRRRWQLLGYAALYRPGMLRWAYGNPLRRALHRGDIAAALGDVFPRQIPLHRVGAWRRAAGARAAIRLPAHLEVMHAQAAARVRVLRQIVGISVIEDTAPARGIWPLLMLSLPQQGIRDAALARLWRAGLGVSRMFAYALPDYDYLRGLIPTDEASNAREFAARTLTISNSPWLNETAFSHIVDELRVVCRESRVRLNSSRGVELSACPNYRIE